MNTLRNEEASMSSEEMLDRSTSWTLACDNALLNRLKSFSESLTKNSQTISKECDGLTKDISKLNHKLSNATNEFLMLANNQFVENRVEEFEEFSAALSSSKNVPVVSKTKAEKEAELISKMKQAIQLGLTACSDKWQETENGGKPANRFATTTPYLIGSPKFFSSKYCGLVDESVRVVPSYDSISEDSVSLGSNYKGQCQVVNSNPETHAQAQVQFTMPPPPAFSVVLSDQNKTHESVSSERHGDETSNNGHPSHSADSGIPPPSPSSSSRSSVTGKHGLGSSKENVPRSITDELNKIYGSFAPPPTVEDDSDDDFRPNASAGRIFDDDDDDIFGEKELFPSSKKNTNADFFERTNPSNINMPTPIFSVPPPINPVPQRQFSQPPFGNANVQTLVGPTPSQIANDTPNVKSGLDDKAPEQDVAVSNAPVLVPEAEESISRTKLPPGAVSMFGGLPPPTFNNGTLQQAQTTKSVPAAASSFPAKHDTQIIPTASASSRPTTTGRRTEPVSSQKENVNVNLPNNINTSQPIFSAGTTEKSDNISQGPSTTTKSSNLNRLSRKIPASSLFADDSSDEDIFSSSTKQQQQKSREGITGNQVDFLDPPVCSPFVKQQSVNSNVSVASTKHNSDFKSEKVKPIRTAVKKSIFDESDSDEDLFGNKPFTSETRKESKPSASTDIFKSVGTKKTALTVKTTTGSSLFGDDSDSDSDLFGNKKSSSSTKIVVGPSPVPVNKSLETTVQKPKTTMAEVATNIMSDHENLFQDFSGSKVHASQKSAEELENTNNNEESPEDDSKTEDERADNVTVTIKIRPKSPEVTNADIPKDEPFGSESLAQPINPKPAKKSIFEDSDSDDDIFKSVTLKLPKKSAPVITTPPFKDEDNLLENDRQNEAPKRDTNKKEKVKSLFDDDSDSDSDLFSTKSKVTRSASVKSKSSSPKQSPVQEQSPISFENATAVPVRDDVDATLNIKTETKAAESTQNDKPGETKEESATTKPVGSKISEKIKAMQSGTSSENKAETDATSSKNLIKPKVSVKNLALNLNINPLALKVGAKPPKPGASSTASTPSGETDDSPSNSENSLEDKLASLLPAKKSLADDESVKEDGDKEKISPEVIDDKPTSSSTLFANDGEDHFVDIIKARAKIQRKRRPPSKSFLKSLAVQREKESEQEETETETEKEPNEDAT